MSIPENFWPRQEPHDLHDTALLIEFSTALTIGLDPQLREVHWLKAACKQIGEALDVVKKKASDD